MFNVRFKLVHQEASQELVWSTSPYLSFSNRDRPRTTRRVVLSLIFYQREPYRFLPAHCVDSSELLSIIPLL